MNIYPAIDLLNHQVVRLYQGDYQQQEIFGENPVDFAKGFEKKGAKFLHLVDLDGAKDGHQRHFDLVEQIVEQTNLQVEIGGGIRDEATVKACLATGVHQVILGTIAQSDPELTQFLLQKYGEQIVVGVDARDGFVAVEGWLKTTETTAYEFCEALVNWGCKRVIYTEISRDGTGRGIDLALYQRLNQINGLAITASGGISSLEDIKQLKQAGISGAILGKALYQGTLDLAAAIQAAKK